MDERSLRRFKLLLNHLIEHVDEHVEELKGFEKKLDDEGIIQLIESSIEDFLHARNKLRQALERIG